MQHHRRIRAPPHTAKSPPPETQPTAPCSHRRCRRRRRAQGPQLALPLRCLAPHPRWAPIRPAHLQRLLLGCPCRPRPAPLLLPPQLLQLLLLLGWPQNMKGQAGGRGAGAPPRTPAAQGPGACACQACERGWGSRMAQARGMAQARVQGRGVGCGCDRRCTWQRRGLDA